MQSLIVRIAQLRFGDFYEMQGLAEAKKILVASMITPGGKGDQQERDRGAKHPCAEVHRKPFK